MATGIGFLPSTLFLYGCGMVVSRQKRLQEAWLGGRAGNMTAMEEARAWALREAWQDEGKSSYGMSAHIASKVCKIAPKGPKKAKKEHPSPSAVSQLFAKMDNDRDWFPGRSDQQSFGPAPAINGANQGIIARSATTMKEQGQEPTFGSIVAASPNASRKAPA